MIKEILNEMIKWNKKQYQTEKNWTVYVDGERNGFSIDVNNSAGWRLNPNDDTMIELNDNGKTRAYIMFKEGNIDKLADKMYLSNAKTTWGETKGLTSKDYADIIRVWLDMKNKHNK